MSLTSEEICQAADKVIAKLNEMTDEELIQRLEECADGPIAYAFNPYLFDEEDG